MKKRVSRREFLKYASAGLAGSYITFKTGKLLARMGGGGGGGMGGGGTGSIDPPPSGPFADPVEAINVSPEFCM